MAEFFRITGLNSINFDEAVTGPYRLVQEKPLKGLSEVLTRNEVLQTCLRLPLGIRPQALARGLSVITFEFNIQAATDALMEQYRHDLTETLEAAALYIETRGARGTRGQLRIKADGAAVDSYKTIFYGVADELDARDVLGPKIRGHFLEGMRLTLYCEPYWRPASTTNLVNAVTIYNHDDADANHDNRVDIVGANILGDVEGPIKLKIGPTVSGANRYIYQVSKRTRGTPSSLVHIREAEAATAVSNWAPTADVTCSGTDGGAGFSKLLDPPNGAGSATGYAEWVIVAPSNNLLGRFKTVARAYTDDMANSKLRLSYRFADEDDWKFLHWERLATVDTWAYIDLGTVFFQSLPGISLEKITIRLSYEKEATDIIAIDFIMLVPEDEAVLELETHLSLGCTGAFVYNATGDFAYWQAENNATGDYQSPMALRGKLTLTPGKAHRLYFSHRKTIYGDWLIVHQFANLQFPVTIDYLPQYVSPLE